MGLHGLEYTAVFLHAFGRLVCSLHQEDWSVEHAGSHSPRVSACLRFSNVYRQCLPVSPVCHCVVSPNNNISVLILIDLDSTSFCIVYSAVFLPVIILYSAVFLPVIILYSAVFLPVIILLFYKYYMKASPAVYKRKEIRNKMTCLMFRSPERCKLPIL